MHCFSEEQLLADTSLEMQLHAMEAHKDSENKKLHSLNAVNRSNHFASSKATRVVSS